MQKYLIAALLLFVSLSVHAGERPAGVNIDVRTTLAFKVSDAAVAKFVPAGWVMEPVNAGPFNGANIVVVLVDSQYLSDAGGVSTPPFRGVVLAVPARKIGADAAGSMIVFGIASEDQIPGAYDAYVAGKAAIDRSSSNSGATIQESWKLSGEDGNSLEVALTFKRGLTARAKSTAQTYSGIHPEFYRIYRLDQIGDVVKSSAMGLDRISEFAFHATGPRLTQLFDGKEQLVGVVSTPMYLRNVSLPD